MFLWFLYLCAYDITEPDARQAVRCQTSKHYCPDVSSIDSHSKIMVICHRGIIINYGKANNKLYMDKANKTIYSMVQIAV